jgi:hypothetical protein
MIFGIYNAVVLDNRNYFSTGLIRVRIFNWYGAPRIDSGGNPIAIDDLSTNPDSIDEGNYTTPDGQAATGPTQEFQCRILTPMGGGKNYGMFHLPQANEKGVVAFLDNDFYKPIWMGSYFEPLLYVSQPTYSIEEIPVPNDDITGGTYQRGYAPGKKPAGDPNSIVIRTKHTTLVPQGNNSYDANKIDWSQLDSENLILVGSDQVRVRRYNNIQQGTLNSYQEILMDRSPSVDSDGDSTAQIVTTVNDIQHGKQTVVTQTRSTFSVFIGGGPHGNFQWVVTGGDTGINLIDQFGNKITGNKNGLTLDTTSNSGSTVIVNAATNVQINGSSDNFVRYSYLKSLVDQIFNHVHITQGSSGPTSGPMVNGGGEPLQSDQQSNESEMKTTTVETTSS